MREVFYRSDAINWVWYGSFILDDERGWAVSKGDSYRLHKWDENQGANDHKPTSECFKCETYNGGGPSSKEFHCLSVQEVSTKPHDSIEGVVMNVYGKAEYFIMCDMIAGEWCPRPVVPCGSDQSYVDMWERKMGDFGTPEQVAQWEAMDAKRVLEYGGKRKTHRETRARPDNQPVAEKV